MGAELAVNEINTKGGIDGKKVLLIKEDDGGLVGEGAFFAYRLTRTEMLLGVIGHLNSDISIPASDFYARAKIPQISPGSTSPYFTERDLTKGFVFRTIGRLDDIEVDAVIAQKNKTNPTLYIRYSAKRSAQGDFSFKTVRSEERFYDTISRILLRYVFNRHRDGDRVGRIVVILGSVFTEAKRGYVLKSLKRHLKRDFRKPFYIYFRPTSSDINCQVADYCGWAVYVRAERGEERPWREISNMVRSHFDVFARGTEEYY